MDSIKNIMYEYHGICEDSIIIQETKKHKTVYSALQK